MARAIDPLGERTNALDAFLETKVAEGFRIETHTDTHAIIIVGHRGRPPQTALEPVGCQNAGRSFGTYQFAGKTNQRTHSLTH